MFRILKEVFKSLSKSKILMGALTFLVFISSGIFTLLFDIKTTYNNQFNDYKQVSKLHDLTVDLEMKPQGRTPSDIYKEETYYYLDEKSLSETKKSILIDKKDLIDNVDSSIKDIKFIKASSIFNLSSGEEDFYILASEFYDFLEVNFGILSYINSLNTIANSKINISSNLYSPYIFKKYKTPSIDGDNLGNKIILNSNDIVFNGPFSNIKLKELLTIIPGEDGGFFGGGTSDQITNIKNIYINVKTKESSIDPQDKKTWESENLLFTLTSQQVAQLLGFKLSDQRGVYERDDSLQQNLLFEPKKNGSYIRLDQEAHPKNPPLYSNNLFLPNQNIYKTTDNGNQGWMEKSRYFLDDQGIKIKKTWIQATQNIYQYKEHIFTLNYDFNNSNADINKEWTGVYKEFLETISSEDGKKIEKLSYWEKYKKTTDVVPFSVPNQSIFKSTNFFKEDLKNEDLNKELKNITSPTNQLAPPNTTTNILLRGYQNGIFTQDEINNANADINGTIANILLNKINNASTKSESIAYIDNSAEWKMKTSTYNEIITLVGTENIGLRENLTVKSINENQNNLFHFVNAGNENQEVEFGNDNYIKQNVGKLYNENKYNENKYNENSLLFNTDTNNSFDPNSKSLLITYTPLIIEKLFNGYSVDKNYINPIFYYGKYSYEDIEYTNQRIILLQDTKNNLFGITKNYDSNQYIILTTPSAFPFLNWSIDNNFAPMNDLNELTAIFAQNGFSFAEKDLEDNYNQVIGSHGWAKQDSNYSNKFFVPFKLVLPSSDIINSFNAGNGFEVFSENLMNHLAPMLDHIFSTSDLKILFDAVNTSFTKYGFVNGLMPPSEISTNEILMSFMGIFYEAGRYDSRDFLGIFLNSLVNYMINNFDPVTGESPSFKEDLSTISKIIYISAGINLNLNQMVDDYLISPLDLLKGIRDIISSLDWDNIVITLFEDHFLNNQLVSSTNIGISDALPIIFNNCNETLLKEGINKIILSINYEFLFNNLKNSLSPEDLNIYGPLIDQLNDTSTPGAKPYENVGMGLSEIINLLDINEFSSNIIKNSSIVAFDYVNTDNEIKKISVNTISSVDLMSSLVLSLSHTSESNDKLLDAIIKLLNLSSKTTGLLGIYNPVEDATKIDLYDLKKLNVSKSDDIEESNNLFISSLDKVKAGDRDSLTSEEIKAINYFLNFDSIDMNSLSDQELISRLEFGNQMINQFGFESFDFNNDSFIGSPTTIADKFMKLINPNSHSGNWGFVESMIKGEIYNQFYNSSNHPKKYDLMLDILNFYGFWIDYSLVSINNDLDAKQEINHLIQKLNESNDFSRIIKQSSESLNNVPLFAPTLYDGFTNPKKIVLELVELLNQNPSDDFLSSPLKNYFFSKLSDGTYTYNSKTFTLVYASTFLVSAPEVKKLITTDFFDLFLNGDNEENKEKLKIGKNAFDKIVGPSFNILESVGLSSTIMSVFSGVLNPGVVLWYTVNQNATSENDIGNIQFVLKEKLYKIYSDDPNLTTIGEEGLKNIFSSFVNPMSLVGENVYDPDQTIKLALDIDQIDDWTNKFSIIDPNDPNNKIDLELFGFSINEFLNGAIDSFVEIRIETNEIVAYSVGSYFAKVNEAFLSQNKKEAFVFKDENSIPKNSFEMENLLRNIDDKYKINANGLEYLIIGSDSTVDYIYPVVDSQNVQVNTKNQAIVYVNQLGFDRIKLSNANSYVDRYLLVSKGDFHGTVDELKDKINLIINNNINGTSFNYFNPETMKQFAYKYNEVNPLKIERSLRVSAIEEIINNINFINFIISLFLISLIAIIVIFIVRRYISSKSKVFGILKAQGYSRLQIALSMCVLTLFVSIIGGAFGYILGHFLQIPIMNIFSTYWTLPVTPLMFNFWSLLVTIIIPFVMMSLLAIIVSVSFLKKKPFVLIDKSYELNQSKASKKINHMIKNTSIKNKFSINLALNSIWKLISLFAALVVTSTVTLFTFSTNNIFNKVTNLSYKNKDYNYKIDLLTPTLEGGQYSTFDIDDDFNDSLYVPWGNSNEGSTYIEDYFQPGFSSVINTGGHNGNPNTDSPHVISKSSLDLSVSAGNVNINTWNALFNSLPDAQKNQIVSISQASGKQIQNTQDDIEIFNEDQPDEYAVLKGTDIRTNYFKFIFNNEIPSQSKFVYRSLMGDTNRYQNKDIIIGDKSSPGLRDTYRSFLVDAYNKLRRDNVDASTIDFFLMFGAINYDDNINEKYSWAQTEEQKIIYGYKMDSKFISIKDNSDKNLLIEANNYYQNKTPINNTYPIIINQVIAQKYNYQIGDNLSFAITNKYDRSSNQILEKINISHDTNNSINFEIIGINDTYINEEWSTTQEVVNEITHMDQNSNLGSNTAFNGLFSKSDQPSQINESLSLYSKTGYWAGEQMIDLNYEINTSDSSIQDLLDKNRKIFKEIFYKQNPSPAPNSISNISVLSNTLQKIDPKTYDNDLTIMNSIEKLINQNIDINDDGTISEIEANTITDHDIKAALEVFVDIYGSEVMSPLLFNVSSKDIESGFASQTSSTINSLSTALLVASFLISITILILISTLIINENEKSIGIFSVLGYSTKEKLRMFLSIYIPILVLAILVSIPLTIGLNYLFVGAILKSTMMVLPLSISVLNFALSSLLVLVVFSFSLLVAWYNINKVKAISMLKGD